MDKNFRKILSILAVTALLPGAAPVFAQIQDQSSNIQKAFESVKGQVDNLVSAKDENNTNELALRIETFKKVIELSLTEAKDLKVKLLGFDFTEEEMSLWQKNMIEKLNAAVKYYEEQKQSFDDKEKAIDLETIKTAAQEFKNWREENYLGASNQINDFLLISEESQAVRTTKKRFQKISDDVQKIQRTKIRNELNKFLSRADGLVKEGEQMNKDAENLFREKYIVIPEEKTVVSTSSASENIEIKNTSTTNVEPEATSTDIIPTLSIKDLVKGSLVNLKGAYQIFIEMSNYVRKLLK